MAVNWWSSTTSLTLLSFQSDTRQYWERRDGRTQLRGRHHFKSVHRDSQRHPVHHPDVPQVAAFDLRADRTRQKHTGVKATVSKVFFLSFTQAHCFYSPPEELKPARRGQQGGVQCDNAIPGHLSLRGHHLPVELERPYHYFGHRWNHHQVKKKKKKTKRRFSKQMLSTRLLKRWLSLLSAGQMLLVTFYLSLEKTGHTKALPNSTTKYTSRWRHWVMSTEFTKHQC